MTTHNTKRAILSLNELAQCTRRGKNHASLESTPYWYSKAETAPPEPSTPLSKKTDIAVVGAGFTGLSAALTLSRAGREVILLDADELGAGASRRNGGQVGSGNQKFRVKKLIELVGKDKAIALLKEGVAMLDNIETLINEENIDCHFTRCGRFRGAVHPNHYEAMARDMDNLHKLTGVESYSVARSEQYNEINSDYFYGGSVLPHDASVHPGKLHAGLLKLIQQCGVQTFAHTKVHSISKNKTGFELKCGDHKLFAKEVIIATNGYRETPDEFCKKRIVPIESAIISTAEMDPETIKNLMPSQRVYGNTARVFFYFRPAPDSSRILWGGRTSRVHGAKSASAYAHLARDLLEVFPDLKHIEVERGWRGTIGYTFDEFPHFGKGPKGLHYAVGYCGTGVSRSIWFGKKVAEQLLGTDDAPSAFSELDFPTHLFQAIAPAAVPMYESWYRLRDYLNR